MRHRFRGNPEFLATIAVAGLSLLAGLVVYFVPTSSASAMTQTLAGALFGATASAITGLMTYLLGTADSRGIPLDFIAAARSDVLDTGYYKSELVLRVTLDEQTKTYKIKFASTVVRTHSNAAIKPPRAYPPTGLAVRSMDIEYRIGETHLRNWTGDDPIPLGAETMEECEITYHLESMPSEFVDDHRSTCPVQGLTLTSCVPSDCQFSATVLIGDKGNRLPQIRSFDAGRYEFRFRSSWFSHQGFRWTLHRTGPSQ